MDSAEVVVFTSDELKACTNNFNKKNLIGDIQYGKLYRGQIKRGMFGTEVLDVTVKIWDEKSDCLAFTYDDEFLMVKEEVKFLTNPSVNGHPNLAKLVSYCCEKEMKGVVYDLNSQDTLHNLAVKDDLNWPQRVKVILELAGLLKFLHGHDKPYLVFNFSASHIMLDWDWKAKLIDFGLSTKEIIGEMSSQKKHIINSAGCTDPYFTLRELSATLATAHWSFTVLHTSTLNGMCMTGGDWQTSCEVFSFGVILLGLIAKRISDPEKPDLVLDHLVHVWAKNEYKPNCSLFHKSLQEDWDYHAEDGIAVTELGMHCIEFFPVNRPLMKDVVERLEHLLIFYRLGDTRPRKREKKFDSDTMGT